MSENFHLLNEKGKKCWEEVKQGLQLDPETFAKSGCPDITEQHFTQ